MAVNVIGLVLAAVGAALFFNGQLGITISGYGEIEAIVGAFLVVLGLIWAFL